MSMPSKQIKCSKCNFESSTRKNWGAYSYLINGKEVNLARSLGWCHKCDNVAPIEVLEDYGNLTHKLDLLKEKLLIKAPNLIMKFVLYLVSKSFRSLNYKVSNTYTLLNMSKTRDGRGRCLNCGSEDNQLLLLNHDDSDIKNIDGTSFLHPVCSGSLYTENCSLRFIMKFNDVYFDFNGRRIKK